MIKILTDISQKLSHIIHFNALKAKLTKNFRKFTHNLKN